LNIDQSNGWNDIADQFIAARSLIGRALVRNWARDHLPHASRVIDIGCGSGVPITEALIDEGFDVFAIDAAPNLIAAFRDRFPKVPSVCEPAQESEFFGLSFDAAVSIGLMFLLSAEDQKKLIDRVARALRPGGRFLFTAPRERCEWQDVLTGRQSISLGEDEYVRLLREVELDLVSTYSDEGDNHYFDAVKLAV
jgi:SAM-dependent methyltransferase